MVVNHKSETWLRQGFPWVYPDEVEEGRAYSAGTVVPLLTRQGQCLGTGIRDQGWIAVRRFRTDEGPLDRDWLSGVLDRAAALRDRAIDANTTAYRLVHAECDGLPGVRVDVYGWYVVVSLDSPSLMRLLEPICDLLEERLDPRGIFLAWRPDPRDDFDPGEAPTPAGLVRGQAPSGDVRVTERGIACLVRPGAGKDIGLYMDMRDNRAWLEPHWGGRRVLNLFAHTGFFSVCAAMHGATETVSVDLSEGYLDRAEQNFAANQLDPTDHVLLAEDVRRALDRFRRTQERFDLIVLDPPAFARGKAGAMRLAKDLPALVAAALRVLSEDGWLVASTNLGNLSPRDFHRGVREGGQKAGVALQLIHEGTQATDFPAHTAFPEGRYLKLGVWRRIG